MSKVIFDPLGIFEQNEAKGGVCDVKNTVVTLTAATNNQSVIAAVSGKYIIVLEGSIYSAGVATELSFINGSGGVRVKNYYVPANTVASPNIQLQPTAWGLIRTTSGVGVFANVGAGANVVVSLSYIEVAA